MPSQQWKIILYHSFFLGGGGGKFSLIQTSWMLLNMVIHSQTNDFQKYLEPQPKPKPEYMGVEVDMPPPKFLDMLKQIRANRVKSLFVTDLKSDMCFTCPFSHSALIQNSGSLLGPNTAQKTSKQGWCWKFFHIWQQLRYRQRFVTPGESLSINLVGVWSAAGLQLEKTTRTLRLTQVFISRKKRNSHLRGSKTWDWNFKVKPVYFTIWFAPNVEQFRDHE